MVSSPCSTGRLGFWRTAASRTRWRTTAPGSRSTGRGRATRHALRRATSTWKAAVPLCRRGVAAARARRIARVLISPELLPPSFRPLQDATSAPEYDDGSQRAPALPIEGGTSLEKAAEAIRAHGLGSARVLEVEARDLSALCGFEDLKRSQTFDNAIAVAFTNHVAICGEEDNILPVANWDPVKLPLNCTQGYRPPEGMRASACKRTHCNCKG